MLKLEQIEPYVLLLDDRTEQLTRVFEVTRRLDDSVHFIATNQEGHLVRSALHRQEEQHILRLKQYPHLKRDPAAVLGCLLGGAVGDALGAPVEFNDWPAICDKFGDQGITDFVPVYGHLGAITDDTQMMLFTAEGLLRAHVRGASRGICHPPSVIHHSLLRWLLTQGMQPSTKPDGRGQIIDVGTDGWLFQERRLWARRAPGRTCISALRASKFFGDVATNNSKGCGGVMRVAPCAFFGNAFENAADSSHMTHGHPTGYLAAGLFADILERVWLTQIPLADAVLESLKENEHREGMEETKQIILTVIESSRRGVIPTPESIEALGGGWIAEEALAIGLWCALTAKSFESGVIRAVNHSGDSDSTGLIAGHFLGLIYGVDAIPARWLEQLEMRDVIEQIAHDITYVPFAFDGESGNQESKIIWERYPGW
jgi:ADP-ribosylglycohydrolase